ncbi:phosphoglycolate phosphatase [Kitasatospora sp. GAS204A]|uniref:HAD family hydrolase n=1 Tax=unclassified Kitasatospora TaxID=2633591 RepID=UPI00247684FC|nr:HAD hydrolase-like protein [Kitasatospora sp. GAS204B]MDH6119639.1 phosphoglycolate phosphatase [Kitasatospora sp. GAS204B]
MEDRAPVTPLTVGFDLDMTLIDTRPGIKRCYDLLAAETGTAIDSDLVVSRLGPPVEQELANWFPAEAIQTVADRYRALYAEHGIEGSTALPGAHEAIAAVRRHGGRVIVVTGKYEPNARRNLDAARLPVDGLYGTVFGAQKGAVLRAEGASVYVGDHLGDIEGARVAGALAVAVATGPYAAAELAAAGADAVLPQLTAFPRWLADLRS